MDLLIYLPANGTGPVPLLLNINFMPNNLAVDDPAVKIGRMWDRRQNKRVPAEGGRRFGRLQVLPTVERGFGIATFNYADVDPDVAGAIQHGVRRLYLPEGQSEPAARRVGHDRGLGVGNQPCSRLLRDRRSNRRFADCDYRRVAARQNGDVGGRQRPANCDGDRELLRRRRCRARPAQLRRNDRTPGGADALPLPIRRQLPEVGCRSQPGAHGCEPAGRAGRPAPLLLQTGTSDKWSDPKGEFLAAVAATPVYELFGKKGIGTNKLPPAGQLAGETLAFYMHDGGHGLVPSDWDVYLDFMDAHLKP